MRGREGTGFFVVPLPHLHDFRTVGSHTFSPGAPARPAVALVY
ncbi:hypothetical protein FTUN_0878 [Frigoriglobus tundricola]|uniref:Uncharacterized protein n=1 Tax=Frigoriglobus tundricola TaxID=2774151 RepID=A0A6M5YK64_9BACT|nr:hypothetical protein FTUN_0878 [Frigoriglobus tundricola]